MIKRKIIKIDETLCDGCKQCIPSCPEGALQIIGGKAKLVKESYCDGLGACLGDCPQGALSIVEKETEEYNEVAVREYLKSHNPDKLNTNLEHMETRKKEMTTIHSGGCPSSRIMQFETKSAVVTNTTMPSQLRQWPIQLHLLSPHAPYFKNANIILVADCVPFAYANFHPDFMKENAIAIGCPKLDDVNAYVEKVSQIFIRSNPKSIKVVVMEVPCCSRLVSIAQHAAAAAELKIPIEVVVIGIRGDILAKEKTKHG